MSSEQRIHPTALIDPSAEIAPDVEIGPFCCIGPRVQIGAGTVLHSRVDIIQNATIGSNCQIHSGTVLGGPPQDRKYQGRRDLYHPGRQQHPARVRHHPSGNRRRTM